MTVKISRSQILGWMITASFFIGFLYFGLRTYTDYGVSYDEEAQMSIGDYFYDTLMKGGNIEPQEGGNYFFFGSSFDMVLHLLTINITIRRNEILTRHLLIFLCFYVSVIFFYLLSLKIFRNWLPSLIACLFLVLQPRILADSFYNSKDIPFLAFFIIASYTMMCFLQRPMPIFLLIHAIISSYLISIRFPGIIMPVITIFFLLFKDISFKSREAFFSKLKIVFFYMLFTMLFIIIFIPAFWHDPIREFINTISLVKNYPWKGTVLYRGEFIRATELPWHYLPTWIGITTPLGILFLFFVGLYVTIKSMFEKGREEFQENRPENFYPLLWLLIPTLAVIIFRSTMYDGWRHMFFIYPALALIAAQAISGLGILNKLKNNSTYLYSACILIICGLVLFEPISFMVKYHPYEYVYFNRLAGKDMAEIKRSYELDYWGISYIKGLEYVVRSDDSDHIFIKTANPAGELNGYLLTRKNRKRIEFVDDVKQADYFITNYRWHPQPYDEYTEKEVYSININGASILSVFRLKEMDLAN